MTPKDVVKMKCRCPRDQETRLRTCNWYGRVTGGKAQIIGNETIHSWSCTEALPVNETEIDSMLKRSKFSSLFFARRLLLITDIQIVLFADPVGSQHCILALHQLHPVFVIKYRA